MSDITVIPGSQCIGDSLATINANFASLNNFVLPVTNTTLLNSANNNINKVNKFIGKVVFNTADNKVYVSIGTEPTSRWYVVDGSAYITPA